MVIVRIAATLDLAILATRMPLRSSIERLLVSLAFVLAAACGTDPLVKLRPKIEVEPSEIDFGPGIVRQENIRPLVVRNRGSGTLELSQVEIAIGSQIYRVRDAPKTVAALSERRMSVVFVPLAAHEIDEGAIVFHSNDPERPALRVPLHGTGGVRKIVVVPLSIDFGLVNEGAFAARAIEIRNVGGDALEISSVTWTSTSADLKLASRTFTAGVLAPRTSTAVSVVYSPIDLGSDRGVVSIHSNDEERPVIDVPVRGDGNLAPRAIAWGCEKPGAVDHVGCDGAALSRALTVGFSRHVGLDGRESYDPEGGPIVSYEWRLVSRAPDSRAAVHYSSSDIQTRKKATADIDIDRIGQYDLRLVVQDEHGLDSLDRPESHVRVTPRDLQILVRWDVATNVDLHFVRPGGAVGDYGNRTATSTGSDCSTYNRRPRWSDLPNRSGDPLLDRDEVIGTGPVIISMDNPIDRGTYRVFVHYCDSRDRRVPVKVTVEVRVRGELVATVPESGPGYPLLPSELWEAAWVTWDAAGPRAAVQGMTLGSPTSAPRLCRLAP